MANELDIIEQIVFRYISLAPDSGQGEHMLFMTLEFAHEQHPLMLDALLIATEEDFLHDVGGIAKNFNRNTGNYNACFWPRYAAECGSTCKHGS